MWRFRPEFGNSETCGGRRLCAAEYPMRSSWRQVAYVEKFRWQLAANSFRPKVLGRFLRRDRSPPLPSYVRGRSGLAQLFCDWEDLHDLLNSVRKSAPPPGFEYGFGGRSCDHWGPWLIESGERKFLVKTGCRQETADANGNGQRLGG